MKLSLGSLQFYSETVHSSPPKVAISACLMGEPVRYDGTDKLLETTSTILDNYLQLISICPEVEAGMPVPRPPIQLVEYGGELKVLGRDDPALDATARLDSFRQHSLSRQGAELSGYICKSRSPSCGLDSTPVFSPAGVRLRNGSGVQADYFRRHLPWLQMADEVALNRVADCEDFIVRCQLLADVRVACATAEPDTLHTHYHALITHMAESQQRALNKARQCDQPQRYWQAFGIGLRTLQE